MRSPKVAESPEKAESNRINRDEPLVGEQRQMVYTPLDTSQVSVCKKDFKVWCLSKVHEMPLKSLLHPFWFAVLLHNYYMCDSFFIVQVEERG